MFRRLPALRSALSRAPVRASPSAAFRLQLPTVTLPTGRRHINVQARSEELIEQQREIPRFQRHIGRQVVNVVNPQVIEKALDTLGFYEGQYKHIIDLNPSACLWSAAVHDRIKPKTHTLLETDSFYHPYAEELCKTRPNAYLVKLNGHDWPSYDALFKGPYHFPRFPKNYPGLDVKFTPPEEGISSELLIIGSLPKTISQRLTQQFVNSCSTAEWVQAFGRVRFVLWLPDVDKERLMPRSISARLGPSVLMDTFTRVREVCSSGTIRTGKGFQAEEIKLTEAKGNIEKIRNQKKRLDARIAKWSDRPGSRYMWAAQKSMKKFLVEHIALIEGREFNDPAELQYNEWPLENLYAKWHEVQDHLPRSTMIRPPLPPPEVSYEPTKEEEQAFAEFEETLEVERAHDVKRQTWEDEQYGKACVPPLLQYWRQQNEPGQPFVVQPKDFLPNASMCLIDFQPTLLDPYLRDPSPEVRRDRYATFLWMNRTLFNSRAKRLKVALKMLCPGAENLLELIPNGKELGQKRVRALMTSEIVEILKAWDEWEFKPDGVGAMAIAPDTQDKMRRVKG